MRSVFGAVLATALALALNASAQSTLSLPSKNSDHKAVALVRETLPLYDLKMSRDGSRVLAEQRSEVGPSMHVIYDTIADRVLAKMGPTCCIDAAFSKDGGRLHVVLEDAIETWDTNGGMRVSRAAGFGPIRRWHRVFISPDGQRALTWLGEDPEILTLWDVPTHKRVAQIGPGTGLFEFSPEGSRFVTSSPDGPKLWDASDGRLIATLTSDTLIEHVAFTPDGKRLLTATHALDDKMRKSLSDETKQPLPIEHTNSKLWNAETGALIRSYNLFLLANDMPISSDGHVIATTTREGGVAVVNLDTGMVIARRDDLEGAFPKVFSSDGRFLLLVQTQGSGAPYERFTIADAASMKTVAELQGMQGDLSAAFVTGGSQLLLHTYGPMQVWDVAKLQR